METGVARRPIADMAAYSCSSRRGAIPIAGTLQRIYRARPAQSEARRLRRGRGGAGDPRRGELRQPGARHGHPGRPRGPRVEAARDRRRHRAQREGIEIQNARTLARAPPPMPSTSTSGCSGRATCSATASGWSTTTATISPPAWWRWATPTPWSTGVTRNYLDRARGRAPRHRRQARATASSACRSCWRAGAPSSSPTPPCTTCRPPRSWPTSPSRRPAWRGGSATSRASPCSPISTFGHPEGERAERVREAVRILDRAAGRFRI